jgi:catechol 2,3-dioxygenase-like lactoylglutathione lyase family enzyme
VSKTNSPTGFNLGFRVSDLGESTAFYTEHPGLKPKEQVQRFSPSIVTDIDLNLVLLVNDGGLPLHDLWLRDPTRYFVESDARSLPQKLAVLPASVGADLPGSWRRSVSHPPYV